MAQATTVSIAALKKFSQLLENERERFGQIKSSMDKLLLKGGVVWEDKVARKFKTDYEEGLKPIEEKLFPAMEKYLHYLDELVIRVDGYAGNDTASNTTASNTNLNNLYRPRDRKSTRLNSSHT